jgi:coenzyme F420-reducing hydrogenase beta subunit
MKPMDNSDFLQRMEINFQEFLRMLGAHKSRNDITEQENKQFMELIFSKIGAENQLSKTEMRTVAEKENIDCSGCGLCANICPQNAIQMQMDMEGFYRPVVDSKICINCGICVKSCVNDAKWSGLRKNNSEPRAYAFKHSNEEVRSNSRSGGFFTVISDYVLQNDGVVYGSAFKEGTQVKHIRAVTYADRDRMRGSKYVMSPSFELFPQIKADLREGRWVLYSGCPCQVAAVKKYVEEEDCRKLILVDLLCYGVPSIRVWNDYVDYCQKKKNGRIINFQFRNKQRFGWAAHKESYVIKGREYTSNAFTDLFHSHQILNKACSKCNFKSTDRVSDFTLGDFWGIDDAIPGFNDDKGVSLVLVNTERGAELFEDITEHEDSCVEVPLSKCMQNSMKFSYPLPKDRTQFWDDYNKLGIDYIIKDRAHKARIKNTKRFIIKCLCFLRGH